MGRRITAHDLADYARCPRAWWYERHHELAALDVPSLEARRAVRRAALGRRARNDPELLLIERLLARRSRFAGGIASHAADARRVEMRGGGWGCLPATLILLIGASVVPIMLPTLTGRRAQGTRWGGTRIAVRIPGLRRTGPQTGGLEPTPGRP